MVSNDSMVEAQRNHPNRIRWYTSLPWEYPERAIEELIRCCEDGASGVMVLANIAITYDIFIMIASLMTQEHCNI